MIRVTPRPPVGRPRVSVAVPSYNYGRYLRASVDSALSQKGVDVEVIIVDNASTDGTTALAHRLAEEDPRVRVIARTKNLGHISAFNEGMWAAASPYVVLLCADDLLAPGSLARSAAVLDARPEVGMVYGYAPYFDQTPPAPRTHTHSWRIWSGPEWTEQVCRRGRNVMFTPEAMLRTSVFAATGGFDQRLPHTADLHLWLCAAAHGSIAHISGPDQAYFRIHGANISVTEFGDQLHDITQRRRAFDLFFDGHGQALPGAERLRAAATTALGHEALAAARARCGAATSTDHGRLAALAAELAPGLPGSRPWRSYQRRAARDRAGRGRTVAHRAQALALRATMWTGRRLDARRWVRFGV